MPSSRSIPPDLWEHARKALVFYFSRRLGLDDAEDLAHETLTAVLEREDYEFQNEKDFLLVCYGFARNVTMSGIRSRQRRLRECENFEVAETGSISKGSGRMNAAEFQIFLKEVREIGQSKLTSVEWQLLELGTSEDRARIADELNMSGANQVRVNLHRARKKLAKLVGWK